MECTEMYLIGFYWALAQDPVWQYCRDCSHRQRGPPKRHYSLLIIFIDKRWPEFNLALS